jgi:hypothetical protein
MHQPKIQVHRFICIAALLAACMALPRTYCQELATTSNAQPENPAGPGKSASLPQITVTAKVLQQRIDTYISTISGGFVRSDDHPMARWRDPICPLVAGLAHDDGQLVFDRLTDDLRSTSIPLGQEGCRPNFFIIATIDPVVTLKSLWHHAPHMSGGQTGFNNFIDTARPVRVWYNAKLVRGDGTPTTSFGLGPKGVLQGVEAFSMGVSPQVEFVAVPDLKAVIVVVDLTRVVGLDWRQVTDYIAMAGVTKVNLDARMDGSSTIMSLFAAPADARPQALSSWDRSFIKELYTTDAVDRHQRVEIAKAMFNDVAPGSVERK